MTFDDVVLDAIASEERREWLSPDEAFEMAADVVEALKRHAADLKGA